MNSESIRKVRRLRSIRHKLQPIFLFASIAILLLSSACHFPRVDVQATAAFLSARQTLVARQLTPGSVVSTPENPNPLESTKTIRVPQPTIPPLETPLPITPAPEKVCELDLLPGNMLYCSQSGDRLKTIARRFRLSKPSQIQGSEGFVVDMLLPVNTPLGVPTPTFYTPHIEAIFPDSEVLYGPDAASSDIIAYAAQAGGYLSHYREYLHGGWYSGPEIIDLVARETSSNSRLLLSFTEFQSGWVFGWPDGAEEDYSPLNYEASGVEGLYAELQVAARELSRGFYGWREGTINGLFYHDGENGFIAPHLNPGTVAVQYLFAGLYDSRDFADVLYGSNGYLAFHEQLFGDPWLRAAAMGDLLPAGIFQPDLTLPFLTGETWALTSGPHITWQLGSPRGAIDLAPVDDAPGCAPSPMWATAAAPGLVVRSERGAVAIDLDGDGNEGTGWVLIYMHLLPEGRAQVGTWLDQDDRVGHPSCEGGAATGTHLHIARKYNGEWIAAEGPLPFVLGGWQAMAGEGNYGGRLVKDGAVVYNGSSSKEYTWIRR